jgi:DNA mismatch repair protein MutL
MAFAREDQQTSYDFMARIHQLPPSVITKIAAGEVIERPASVVKELLENSVDAGCTRIDLEIEQGGMEMIRVVDDGCGIEPDDLPIAFASHATSKLGTADDLFHIHTLGFRGEALASIGGVAQVTLQSRAAGTAAGAEICCHGGELSPLRAWNGAEGTRIEVRHLYFNTPVRRKFLRTSATEMGHITEAAMRQALAHPTTHLTLRHNGKLVHEVPATAGLLDRISLFFGPELREKLYVVEAEQAPVALRGFIADPSYERGNAKMQYLFVNRRCIRDRSLSHALQEAFRGLLMTGRFPVAFLFLEMPPDQVDVNVHPTKAEIRFRDAQAMHHLVFAALKDRLRRANLTPRLQVPSSLGGAQTLGDISSSAPLPEPPPWTLTAPPAPAPTLPLVSPLSEDVLRSPFERDPHAEAGVEQLLPSGSHKAIQLYDTYLVLETPAGMLVIDQHALHERILFEQLKERLRAGPLESQRLLIPEPVDLTAEQAARTLEQREALSELGLVIEEFGGGTVLLTSYPALFGQRSPQSILKSVVDHLVSKDHLPTREVLLNDLLSLMACHAAVRAGDHLTAEQIAALVAQRELADDTHHCPHGRPTALLFSRHDLERQFRRI